MIRRRMQNFIEIGQKERGEKSGETWLKEMEMEMEMENMNPVLKPILAIFNQS